MLKRRPTDQSHTCRPPDAFLDWTHQRRLQEGTESNGYRGTESLHLFTTHCFASVYVSWGWGGGGITKPGP